MSKKEGTFRPYVTVTYGDDGEVATVTIDWNDSYQGDDLADLALTHALDRWLLAQRPEGDPFIYALTEEQEDG